MRSYVSITDPETLRSQLGSGVTEVARVVSEVREQLPGLPEPSVSNEPEQAQFRLFDAIRTFLKNAANSRPMMVVLGGFMKTRGHVFSFPRNLPPPSSICDW